MFPKASLGRKLGAEIVERVNTEVWFFFPQVADKEQHGEQISLRSLSLLCSVPVFCWSECLLEI